MVITVSLPPFLGRSEAATFRNQLLVALEQKESVAVECADAGPLPSLWIQLLHSAATSARARGLSVNRTGLAAARNRKPFLLQSYRRDMGGGQFLVMEDLSAPILVKGRHWGGFRIGLKV